MWESLRRVLAMLWPDATHYVGKEQEEHIFRVRRIVASGVVLLIIILACLSILFAYASSSKAVPGSSQSSAAPVGSLDKQGLAGDPAGQGKGASKLNKAGQSGKAATRDPKMRLPQLPALHEQERTKILAQAQAVAQASGHQLQQFSYCVTTKGQVGSADEFENAVFRTLNSAKGWPRAGVTFVQGSEGACDMTMVLSEAQYMTTFDQGCSALYSCRVGNEVIINKDRWNGSTEHWLDAGGTLARYRTMVINHEVGHRLGHLDNEQTCSGSGQPAPLMQEQSMGMQGCVPNEWPLDSELWIG